VASDGYTGAAAATPHRTTLLRYKHRYNLELTDGTFRGQSFDLVKVWKKPMCTTPAGGYFVASTARASVTSTRVNSAISAHLQRRPPIK
jgi:hypothetical protein